MKNKSFKRNKEQSEDQIEKQLNIRQQERFLNKSRNLSSKYLNKLLELPGVPANYQYFDRLLRRVFLDNQMIRYHEDEVFVGTFCVMMPQELIYAAGARPIKMCSGNFIGFQMGEGEAPRDACPLIKAIVGCNMIGNHGISSECSRFVVPITCDCKKKMINLLNSYKDTYALHVPLNKQDDDAMETYIEELKVITKRLSQTTGVEVTSKRLREAVEMIARVQREIYRFIVLKGNKQLLIRGSHAMAVMNSQAYDDIQNWGEQLKLLNDELELRLHQKKFLTKKKLPRILLTGSPMTFPNLKIPLLIEEMGGVIAADETCLGDRGMYDPVSVCENSLNGYYRGIANRYVAPCSCPVFSDNSQRIQRIEQLIKDHQIDGIVYHVLRGCLVYDYEFSQIERYFSEKGIPCIRVESDYNEEDVEQLRIRIEAFVEMIKFKR